MPEMKSLDLQSQYFIFYLATIWSVLPWISGQGGAGPGGSISDYYDYAFGNPFLGYWKNPGNKNPYGTVQTYPGYGSPGGGMGASGTGMSGGSYLPMSGSYDRPSIASPSYAYDRMPGVFEQPGGFAGGSGLYAGRGYSGSVPYYPWAGGATGGLGYDGAVYRPFYGNGYGVGVGAMLGGGYGYPPVAVDSRTPADRALQDLLPTTYANKPWYP